MPRQRESEIGTLTAIAPAAPPPESKYERLIAKAKQVAPAQTIVVHPCDEGSLRGPVEAAELGIIKRSLVPPESNEQKCMLVAKKRGSALVPPRTHNGILHFLQEHIIALYRRTDRFPV